jgi:two-component system NtrC family sensor kinase
MSEPSRILVVDDNESIHHDFRQILDRSSRDASLTSLDELERALGGEPTPTPAASITYGLSFVSQGEDAIHAVSQACAAGRAFGVAFVDIRMPPGIDGIETIERLWQIQPDLEIVLCSAYSDYSWDEIAGRLCPGDRLVVLRKPFDPIEVRQLAACLSEKWSRGRKLNLRLRDLEAQIQSEVEARLHDRARHEEEQRRSQRLQALGVLAAGLAHEINTPAQFANSNLEYLSEVVPMLGAALLAQRACLAGIARGELDIATACTRADRIVFVDLLTDAPKAIADALTGISRISRIVQSVRSHAHLRDREGLVAVDVNEQVRSALELARNEYKHDADAVVELGEVPKVLGDPGDLCLAILNLLINASHAIREARVVTGVRGTLTVSTRADHERVEIRVADTGGGIPAEIHERVFEPFFTTKPIGQGTGQGLSIVRTTIVERHRGSLRFETEAGRGTVFVIGLPPLGFQTLEAIL